MTKGKKNIKYLDIVALIVHLLYPVLKQFKPAYKKNPCYWKTILLYNTYFTLRKAGKLKVNIVLDTRPNKNWGHCWLTIDEIPVRIKNKPLVHELDLVAGNSKYNYWIVKN